MPQMETGQQVTVNTVATAGEPYEIEVTPGLVLANVSADGGPIVYWSRSNSVTPNGPGIPVHPGQGFQFDAAHEGGRVFVTASSDGADLRVEVA